MLKYTLRRGAQAIFSLFVLSVAVFAMVRLTGDPISVLAPVEATQEDVERLRAHYGLDRPMVEQYWRFATQVVQGDFGRSHVFRRPVLDVIAERFPATLRLGSLAALIAGAIALPIGVYAARHRGSILDKGVRLFATLGLAIPNFWLGVVLVLIFAVYLGWFPTSGSGSFRHMVLPAFTLGWTFAAGITRLTRSAMLEVLREEYIKFARIKGASERRVFWLHAMKNAALPILTFGALVFVNLINGSVVVESVFAWPGVGSLVIGSVRQRDFPVIQAVILIIAAMYIVMNYLVDLAYAWLDPTIRYSE